MKILAKFPKSILWLSIVGSFFGSLAILDLNLLALNFADYVPHGSTTDYYHFHWNYWWMGEALQNGQSIYNTTYVLNPLGEVNLGLHTLTPIWFPIWAIFNPLVGSIAAVNLIIWLELVLIGGLMALLLHDISHSKALALLGGAFLMTLPILGRAAELTHLNLLGAFYYPLTLWLWRKVVQSQKITWALALGFVFWLMWLTDGMWLMFVGMVLAPYGILTLFQNRASRAHLQRLIALGILAVGLFMVLSWSIAPWQQMTSFDRATISPAGRDAADLWSLTPDVFLFQPTDLERGHSIGRALMLLLLASLFVRSPHRERWFWLLISLPPLILSLGPHVMVGEQQIDLPYWALHQALGGLFRTPERFVTPFVVAALIFLAQTWQLHLEKIRPNTRLLITVFCFLIIMADLRVLRPIDAAPPLAPYAYHDQMAQDTESYVVMDIPVSMASGWTEVGRNYYTQYYALAHHKKLINGFVARVPDFSHYFYQHDPILGWLSGFQPYDPSYPDLLRERITEWNVGYLIFYQNAPTPSQDWTQDLIARLNSYDFLCAVTVERDAVFYRTEAHPDWASCPQRQTEQIDLGTVGDEIYLGAGFYWREGVGRWIGRGYNEPQGKQGQLFLNLEPDMDYQITLEATAFHEPRQLTLSLNETPLGDLTITPDGYQTYTVDVDAEDIPPNGDVTLTLAYDAALSPSELGLSSDGRYLAISLDKITVENRP